MKILVLQLARFGDIYLTWPTLRGLRRQFPDAEIHVIVREKFAAALDGLGDGFIAHMLPTAELLRPILESGDDQSGSLDKLDQWLKPLQSVAWNKIINLSFSPSSSYIVDLFAGMETDVRGYARHSDGYLSIPDDASAYFYAQVGPSRHNRYHLVDVFAMIAEVEIQSEDWGFAGRMPLVVEDNGYVIFHLGASQSEKRYPVDLWKKLVELVESPIYLIGSNEEEALAEQLATFAHVRNLIGKTRLAELFPIIKGAELLVGADSAPIHIAAHVGTPVLNISFSSVSFWETGPCSKRSAVLVSDSAFPLGPEKIVKAMQAIANGGAIDGLIQGAPGPGIRFQETESSFEWKLIQALYTDSDYPSLPPDVATESGVTRLAETVELALEQLTVLKANYRARTAVDILSSVDLVLTEIPKLAPRIAPLVGWFETERLRIPPGDIKDTFHKTEKLFQDLKTILQVFTQPALPFDAKLGLSILDSLDEQLMECASSFRLFQTAVAEPKLQQVLGSIAYFDQGAPASGSTNVEARELREILAALIQAFEKKDYIFVADILEYEMSACLSKWRTSLVKSQTDVLL